MSVSVDQLDQTKPAGPVGIGGWLILPMIGFVGTIGLTLKNLVEAYQQREGLEIIFSSSAAGFGEMRVAVVASLIGGLVVIASALASLVLIAKKHRMLSRVATVHYVFLLAASLCELWGDNVISRVIPGTGSDPNAVRDVVRTAFAASIWIPYFNLSKRVRNTFTNGAPTATTTPLAATVG